MFARRASARSVFAGCALVLAGCGDVVGDAERSVAAQAPAVPVTADAAPGPRADATTVVPPSTSAVTSPTTAPIERVVIDTGFSPFAVTGDLVLHHPAARVERIGFHESGHDGAQQMGAALSAARPVEMETRDRGTGGRTAADIVVPPDAPIRVPVTGTVVRAGGYVLYCDHADDFAVIEPDARPGWEVKVFHIDGVLVRAGDRVEAGVTPLAPRATVLPFESQVDELTATPSWPHVHVEVVDPTIPDRPTPGGGCS